MFANKTGYVIGGKKPGEPRNRLRASLYGPHKGLRAGIPNKQPLCSQRRDKGTDDYPALFKRMYANLHATNIDRGKGVVYGPRCDYLSCIINPSVFWGESHASATPDHLSMQSAGDSGGRGVLDYY